MWRDVGYFPLLTDFGRAFVLMEVGYGIIVSSLALPPTPATISATS